MELSLGKRECFGIEITENRGIASVEIINEGLAKIAVFRFN